MATADEKLLIELMKANETIESLKHSLIRCAVIFSEAGDNVSASNARSWACEADVRVNNRHDAILSAQIAAKVAGA